MSKDGPLKNLDWLYRLLLTPATFLILITWTLTIYEMNLCIEHPDILKLEYDLKTMLLTAPMVATHQIIALCISIISYSVTFFEKGKAGYMGKFLAFLFLLFAIFITAGIYLASLWFWPLLPGLIFIVVWFIVSFGLTSIIVRRAQRSE